MIHLVDGVQGIYLANMGSRFNSPISREYCSLFVPLGDVTGGHITMADVSASCCNCLKECGSGVEMTYPEILVSHDKRPYTANSWIRRDCALEIGIFW